MFNETITRTVDGKEYTFSVIADEDDDNTPPWERHDGHGVISEWERRDKAPDEIILDSFGSASRFYDFKATCAIALRDGWDAAPYNDGRETPKQQAAKAALADFKNLKAWCDNDWRYIGVVVTLLDCDGEKTNIKESLWGIESNASDYLNIVADELAGEVMAGRNTVWAETIKTTYTTI